MVVVAAARPLGVVSRALCSPSSGSTKKCVINLLQRPVVREARRPSGAPATRPRSHPCRCSFVEEESLVPEQPPKPKGNCYGCGQPLQVLFPDSAGFVTEEQYEVKAKHKKQLNTLFCKRCVALTHGEMVPGVKDFTQKQPGGEDTVPKILTTPEELRDQLKAVQTKRAMVVMLVDLLDASGSFLGRVRDLVGGNPVMLIGTKFDLLPKGTHPEDVEGWLLETAAHKRVNVVGVKVISSRTGHGVPQAVGAIRKERMGNTGQAGRGGRGDEGLYRGLCGC